MPGVLVCEALAQACALLGILDMKRKVREATNGKVPEKKSPEPAFLVSMNMKFTKPVLPGDQLLLKSISSKEFEGIKAFEVEATVDDETVCKGIIKTTLRKG